MPNDWKQEALELRKEGLSYVDISDTIQKLYFPDEPAMRVYNKVKKYCRNFSKNETNRVIIQNFDPSITSKHWDGSSTIKFAVVSDTHINSKFTQLTSLHDFYNICSEIGIKDIYHVGDIDEGEQMRVGHQYECYTQGGDAHIESILKYYPRIKGITTHFITGNHDASLYKKSGVDIGKRIAENRKDMKYLGQDTAVVKLTDNCKMELRHPWDGTAYAISYKSQKMIESIDDNAKPDIMFVGHYHKQEYIWYRGVHSFQAGTFCAQTNYMKGKGISAAIGGWIISLIVDAEGYLKAITPSFIPYEAIQDDYKNYLK